MTTPADCQLIGRWRIVEADLWDRDYLDLDGPATTPSAPATTARSPSAPCRQPSNSATARRSSSSHGSGFDEMDEVTGDGHAELLDDGSIEITFVYHNGDEAILKAKRDTSSTAC
ncbi:hypothetical protein [Mesorhizobium sp.]|uniref:hypothetical protein n=1 Tax=Mesorhizobium sp. TaxID=1871066 RepID=UPI00257A093C|nr:hypothetical protein [Mesorhizobium sp.]